MTPHITHARFRNLRSVAESVFEWLSSGMIRMVNACRISAVFSWSRTLWIAVLRAACGSRGRYQHWLQLPVGCTSVRVIDGRNGSWGEVKNDIRLFVADMLLNKWVLGSSISSINRVWHKMRASERDRLYRVGNLAEFWEATSKCINSSHNCWPSAL